MPDDSPANAPEPQESPDSTALDHVINDVEPKEAWAEWAYAEMAKGRSPDELMAELAANGWDEEDAAELVETARRQTRHLRGVITRDDIARESASRFHKATALSWFTAAISIASAWRLLNSLAFLLAARRRRPAAKPGFGVEPAVRADPGPRPDGAAGESNESAG